LFLSTDANLHLGILSLAAIRATKYFAIFQSKSEIPKQQTQLGKAPKWSQKTKRIFWGQQVLFGTKFPKFGPKRANLTTLSADIFLSRSKTRKNGDIVT